MDKCICYRDYSFIIFFAPNKDRSSTKRDYNSSRALSRNAFIVYKYEQNGILLIFDLMWHVTMYPKYVYCTAVPVPIEYLKKRYKIQESEKMLF